MAHAGKKTKTGSHVENGDKIVFSQEILDREIWQHLNKSCDRNLGT